jgi:uncharacterized protein (DUF952 family)
MKFFRSRYGFPVIYHWCPSEDWERVSTEFVAPSLAVEGFIHFSYRDQVERTATSIDRGRLGLVLLTVDDSDIEVVVEDCYEIGEEYPHVYGPIPGEAVIAVHPFPPSVDGTFQLPEGV